MWSSVETRYQLGLVRQAGRREGEAKGFTWQDYRDLIIATHRNLSAPLVWCWRAVRQIS
jgi:hypothetical protein